MLLFDLGKLPEQQSMLVFHVLARMGVESLVIVSPQSPLVSIGCVRRIAGESSFRKRSSHRKTRNLTMARGKSNPRESIPKTLPWPF